MKFFQKPKTAHSATALIVIIAIVSLLAGGVLSYLVSYSIFSGKINDLGDKISTLQEQISNVSPTGNYTYQNLIQNITYMLGENFSLSQLYEQVKNSVVVVEGWLVENSGWPFYNSYYSEVQGSGFVSNSTGQFVIITNYHVVEGAINITVTFMDGNAYAATVIGSDPYVDLAVLSANASQDEYHPLEITSSSTLKVGDPVIAIGAPLGYAGSMTSGIVSALGRTVTVDWSNYPIANCIQMSAPINPGSSGGPLLNYQGEVVGITSYGAVDPTTGEAAQGLWLAIPSSAILREIGSLITNGSYNNHPWLGISSSSYFGLGTATTEGLPDLTWEIAKAMNTNITYGVLITQVVSGGPADVAGIRGGAQQATILGNRVTIGGDIIIAINGTRIKNLDDLSAYLEEYTSPGQTINVVVVRANATLTLSVKLEARPPQT